MFEGLASNAMLLRPATIPTDRAMPDTHAPLPLYDSSLDDPGPLENGFADHMSLAVARANCTGQPLALHVLRLEAPGSSTARAAVPPVEAFLLETARRIDETLPGGDCATYLGEATFAVLQETDLGDQGVQSLASKLLNTVSAPMTCRDRQIRLHVTFGLSRHIRGASAKALLRLARHTLLEASAARQPAAT